MADKPFCTRFGGYLEGFEIFLCATIAIHGNAWHIKQSNCMPKILKTLKLVATLTISFIFTACGGNDGGIDNTKEAIGKELFFNTDLSSPAGQSCASCHNPKHAFTDPRTDFPTSEGAVKGIFGRRQTPSIKYMAFSPEFHFDSEEQDFIGGQFWDGRATDLKAQAKFPLLSAREMNNSSPSDVASKVAQSNAAEAMKAVYGNSIFDNPDKAFDAIADAIATFEMSAEFSPFTSKYDYFLQGKVNLTDQEKRGLKVFEASDKGNCAACHPSAVGADGTPPLFTDFTYDNLGVPKNSKNPFYTQPLSNNPDGEVFVDRGLADTTKRTDDAGRMKVPTLRNIAITAPYFHNGAFSTLEEVAHFYNERDLGRFAPPEIADTMNREELGNLKLTDSEIVDLVAYLRTLTDGYKLNHSAD